MEPENGHAKLPTEKDGTYSEGVVREIAYNTGWYCHLPGNDVCFCPSLFSGRPYLSNCGVQVVAWASHGWFFLFHMIFQLLKIQRRCSLREALASGEWPKVFHMRTSQPKTKRINWKDSTLKRKMWLHCDWPYCPVTWWYLEFGYSPITLPAFPLWYTLQVGHGGAF